MLEIGMRPPCLSCTSVVSRKMDNVQSNQGKGLFKSGQSWRYRRTGRSFWLVAEPPGLAATSDLAHRPDTGSPL
jgi:hypothetical protein